MDTVEGRGGDMKPKQRLQSNYYNIRKAIMAELLEAPQHRVLAVRYRHGIFFV